MPSLLENAPPSPGPTSPPAAAPPGLLDRLAAATPERPVRVGRYDVLGTLGRGGMGTVYRALDRDRDLPVALKTLTALDAVAAVRLKEEFRVVADVGHPHLVPVYELASHEGLWFFAMELVEGEPFTRWARGEAVPAARLPTGQSSTVLRAEVEATLTTVDATPSVDLLPAPEDEDDPTPPCQPPAALRRALLELVLGVAALHDAGLRHSDLKPSNVLVRRDGRVVIVDFGLAARMSEEGPFSSLGGTPPYMAPEHLAGDDPGPPADWYSVGVLLYLALTGRVPFHGASRLELYFRKTHHAPPAPHELLPELPVELSELCLALLQPEASARPTASDVLRALSGDGAAVRPPGERGPRSVFVGRTRELERLEHAYARARAGSLVVVHVRGPSGVGKSSLVRSFLRGVRSVDRAQVLSGRCYERESIPYKALDRVVDELASLLRARPPLQQADLVPDGISELVRVFPALLAVPAFAEVARAIGGPRGASQQRQRAWAALIDVLARAGRGRPVVVAIDDLQWADADSAQLLGEVLRTWSDAPLLLVLAYRPDDAARNPDLAPYFAAAGRFAAAGSLVDLAVGALPPDDGRQLAHAALRAAGVAPTEADVAHLVEEAGGLPFFIEALARHRAASRGSAPPSLDQALLASVEARSPPQRALLEVIALAEHPIPQSLALAAAGLDPRLLPELLALRHASLVGGVGADIDDTVAAYHDRIREAVTGALAPGARRARHLALAQAIAARHRDDAPGPWVHDQVRHLAGAGELVSGVDERREAARLAAMAGGLARSSAAFPLALRCFAQGVAWLPEGAWESDYELALGLHGGAAEAAYLAADGATFEAEVAEVKRHARGVLDQLVAWEVQIDAHIGRHEYPAAVDAAVSALAALGLDVPADPRPEDVGAAVARTLAALDRVGPEGLEALGDVTDPLVAAAMRVQVRVSPAAYFSRPLLLPVLACNLVQASVERGLSPATPYALALFGLVLNTLGQLPVAHTWGQLAVRLIGRWEDRSLEAATRHVVFNLVCPWIVPLRDVLPSLREVFDIGRRTGDYEYASYAAHGYTHNALYAGLPLEPLQREGAVLGEQMRALGPVNAIHVHAPFEQLLGCLTGVKPGDPATLDAPGFSEEAELAAAAAEGSRSGIFVLRVVMGLARFHFGRLEEAAECFAVARAHLDAAPSVWHVPILHQFGAVTALAVGARGTDAERAAALEVARASLEALRALAAHAPVNFAHRVALVEACQAAFEGDPAGSAAAFERALEQARAGAWTGDVALVHELVAGTEPDPARAAAARERAHVAYQAWGATAKAARLQAAAG